MRLHLHHHQDSHPGLQLPPGHGGHLLGVALPAPHHAVPDAGLVAELRDGGERGLEAGDEDDLLTLPVGGVEDAVQGLAISQSLGQGEREDLISPSSYCRPARCEAAARNGVFLLNSHQTFGTF